MNDKHQDKLGTSSVTRRKLLAGAVTAVLIGVSNTRAPHYNNEQTPYSSRNKIGDESPLTIDDFGGGVIRDEWGNAANHATTNDFSNTGSHSVYRVNGSSLYDDGTSFQDTFQEDGRFIVWSVYVDELKDNTSFRLGFNADGPPAPKNFSEVIIDFNNDEIALIEYIDNEMEISNPTSTEPFETDEWYEIVVWWGHDTVECWVYEESDEEAAHLQAENHPTRGEYWWLFDEQNSNDSVFDNVRFYETHPFTGRHYTQVPEIEFEKRASDIVISPDGDDDAGEGSYDNPYYSPQAAFSNLDDASDAAGSRVICRGGTYNLTSQQLVESSQGTQSEPIIMRPYADENPVFDFSDASELRRGFYFYNADWWQVRDIEVKEVPHSSEHDGRGILTSNTNNILFTGVESHHNTHDGLRLRKTKNAIVRWSEFHHNYDGGSGNADGIVIGEESSSVIVEYCKVYHNFDDGIDLYFAEPGNVVRYCIAWDNGYDPSMNIQDGWMAAYKMGGRYGGGNLVHHCVAHNDGRGFIANSSKHRNEYYNCVAYDCGEYNFHLDANAWETSDEKHKIRNCISYNGEVFVAENGSDSDYNTWDLGISEPGFRSTNQENNTFLHLQEDSPCIETGTDVGFDYEGEFPDLGAFEYGAEWSIRKG